MLKVCKEGFLERVAMYDARVDLEEEPNDFGVVMAEVVSFNEDSVIGKPIEKSEGVDGGVFEFGDGKRTAENAADRELIFKRWVVGTVV